MTEKQEYTFKQANDVGLDFSLKLKKLQKILKKENDHFSKKGMNGFAKNHVESEEKLQEILALYKLMNKSEIIDQIEKSSLDKISKEHIAFTKIVEQYYINVQASMQVGEMFLDITKENVGNNARESMGYNNKAGFVSDKKILDNMPSVAIDNKV